MNIMTRWHDMIIIRWHAAMIFDDLFVIGVWEEPVCGRPGEEGVGQEPQLVWDSGHLFSNICDMICIYGNIR